MTVEPSSTNGGCQHLCPQLPPASTGGSPRSSSGSDTGSFQTTASRLGLGVCEILCALFKSVFSVSSSLLALPNISPLVFKARRSGASYSPCMTPGLGIPMWGSDPCSLEKTSTIVVFLLFVGHWPAV